MASRGKEARERWRSLCRGCECASVASFRGWRRRGRLLRLDHRDGAVAGHERFVGDPADVGLGDLVDAIDIAEYLTPVAVARLCFSKLLCQAGIVSQPAYQAG